MEDMFKENIEETFKYSYDYEIDNNKFNSFSLEIINDLDFFGLFSQIYLRVLKEFFENIDNGITVDIIADTLKWLGDCDDNRFKDDIRLLLEYFLENSKSVVIRDGANSGISFLNDERSLDCLKRVYEKEDNVLLKKFIGNSIEQFN